jgi:PAS domain S-box-containing protein
LILVRFEIIFSYSGILSPTNTHHNPGFYRKIRQVSWLSPQTTPHPKPDSVRNENNDALILSERTLRLFWDTMGRGVIYHARDGKIILMNPTAERILGQKVDDFQRKTPFEVKNDTIREDGSHLSFEEHPIMESLRTGNEVNDVIIGVFNPSESAYRWINLSAIPLFQHGEAKPYQVYAIFEDITERKKVEEALRQTEERFRKMFEEHQAIMLLIDPENGRIVDGNLAAAEFYGYPRKVLCGLNITSINQLKPEQTASEWQKALNKELSQFIFPHRLASGEVRTVEVHSSPINIDNRSILFSIIHDVTAR